jgi:hypothetical protein
MMKAAPSSKLMPSGMGMQRASVRAIFSAMPPQPAWPITRSPTATLVTPALTASTTPATSPPGEKGRSGLNWYLSSMMITSG